MLIAAKEIPHLREGESRGDFNQQQKAKTDEAKAQKKFLISVVLMRNFQKNGGDLLSRGCAVPSARPGLTSLFGMGRGGTPAL